ncbi:MAG TPA: DVUA0089 family protein [Isosphaeraceae bacterium]|jgi:hypothetical protein
MFNAWMRVISAGALLGLASTAPAAIVIEAGDAGNLPATAQVASGAGTLDAISGTLASGTDVDVFAIVLGGGRTFSATTVGLTDVDTKLYLFDSTGRGVYTNDDEDVFTLQSTLPAGDLLTPLASGLYYLAITSFDIDPVSLGGKIFPDPIFPDLVYGPTGPGGGSPVTGYTGSGESGAYTIALTGARFQGATVVPEPGTLTSLGIAGLGLLGSGWRRRRSAIPGAVPRSGA